VNPRRPSLRAALDALVLTFVDAVLAALRGASVAELARFART
jgi:hypothetical protein